jgi:UDP-glucose 4-epimerase
LKEKKFDERFILEQKMEEIIDIVCEKMDLKNVKFNFTGGIDGREWKGDAKTFQLSIERLKSLGWNPKFNSEEAARECIRALLR